MDELVSAISRLELHMARGQRLLVRRSLGWRANTGCKGIAMTGSPIVSLLPAATEMVCALGLADRLVGISHECGYPDSIAARPKLTPNDGVKAMLSLWI